jgi:hypothetical protein
MGGFKHQGMVVLFGGWRYSSTQSFGIANFARDVGDLEQEKCKSVPK